MACRLANGRPVPALNEINSINDMKTKFLATVRLGCLLSAVTISSGCATRYHITPGPGQGYVTSETARQKAVAHPSADLVLVKIVRNGVVMTTDAAVSDQCLTLLEQAGLFSRVAYKDFSNTDKEMASITIEIVQKERPHTGANVTKAFFIGFTLFLLTPALPMTYGFDSDMKATIHFADGEEVVCLQSTKGKCSYNFLVYPILEVQSKVLQENYSIFKPDFIKTLPTGEPKVGRSAGVSK